MNVIEIVFNTDRTDRLKLQKIQRDINQAKQSVDRVRELLREINDLAGKEPAVHIVRLEGLPANKH